MQAEANLVIEATLAGRGFQRIIHQLKITEYTVAIVSLFLKSPEVCIARVRNRVMAGGHHVLAEDIVRRFYRSKRNFWLIYKNFVDKLDLFYNSGDNLQEVASGQSDEISLTNEVLFELFLDDVKNGGA